MTDTPRVSVVIPVFNAGNYLRNAIDSVLAQSFSGFELLIIDDGSTDHSMQVARSFDDARIRIIANSSNLGLAATRNRGIEEARGEFLAWLDADDISLSTRLAKQVRVLDANPDLALCGSWVRTIGADRESEWRYPTDPDTLRCRLMFDQPFANPSLMLRRSVLTTHGLRYSLDFPPAEDYDLLERLSRLSTLANLGEVLTLYRVHPGQTSRQKSEQWRTAIWRVQERVLASLGITPTEDEKSLHLDIGFGWSLRATVEHLLASRAWLEKLLAANDLHGAFPEPAFSAVLAERWLHVCYALRGQRLGWKTFWRSPLSAHASLRPVPKLKFFLKSFTGLSR